MNKKIGLFVAVFLLTVQILSVWHMAEHAFCNHTHNGKNCDIAFVFDKSKATSQSKTIDNSPLSFFIVKNTSYNSIISEPAAYYAANPRAPPFIFHA